MFKKTEESDDAHDPYLADMLKELTDVQSLKNNVEAIKLVTSLGTLKKLLRITEGAVQNPDSGFNAGGVSVLVITALNHAIAVMEAQLVLVKAQG